MTHKETFLHLEMKWKAVFFFNKMAISLNKKEKMNIHIINQILIALGTAFIQSESCN